MDVTGICAAFALGDPAGPPSYVARGELGRVSRLVTAAGVWAVKEIELFLPTVAEADANVELQEAMLAAGVHLPRPRRTIDGHGLLGNVRVYEWLDMSAVPEGDGEAEQLVAESLAVMHVHAPSAHQPPDLWYCAAATKHAWAGLVDQGRGTWWAPVVAGLAGELSDLPQPDHSPARICHLDVCPENVFLVDGRLTVIDWENAGPAATLQDLGSTLWDFCRGDIGRTRAFVDHYRRHGGPLDRLDEAVFDMARVVQANLIDFHCRRSLDPSAEIRRRAEEGLRACLGRPLTRQLVADIVAAA